MARVTLGEVTLKLTVSGNGLKKTFGDAVIAPFLRAYAKRTGTPVSLAQLARVEVDGEMLGDLGLAASVVLLTREPVDVDLILRAADPEEIIRADPFAAAAAGGSADNAAGAHNARAPPAQGVVDFDEEGRSEVDKLKEARRDARRAREAAAHAPGERVRVVGLASEAGKSLNGRLAEVVRHLPEKGRWEVRVDGETGTVNLLPDKMQAPDDAAPDKLATAAGGSAGPAPPADGVPGGGAVPRGADAASRLAAAESDAAALRARCAAAAAAVRAVDVSDVEAEEELDTLGAQASQIGAAVGRREDARKRFARDSGEAHAVSRCAGYRPISTRSRSARSPPRTHATRRGGLGRECRLGRPDSTMTLPIVACAATAQSS